MQSTWTPVTHASVPEPGLRGASKPAPTTFPHDLPQIEAAQNSTRSGKRRTVYCRQKPADGHRHQERRSLRAAYLGEFNQRLSSIRTFVRPNECNEGGRRHSYVFYAIDPDLRSSTVMVSPLPYSGVMIYVATALSSYLAGELLPDSLYTRLIGFCFGI